MKKWTSLLIMLFLSSSVGCSITKNLTPTTTSLVMNSTAITPTKTSLPSTTLTPTMSATSLFSATSPSLITITPIPTITASYLYSPTSIPPLLPVTDKVKIFFSKVIPSVGQVENVDLKLVNIGYEKNVDTDFTLTIGIQCTSLASSCKSTFARDAFIQGFADPDPQPDKMSMFPTNLEEFKVIGYDENMNQVEFVTGKWSDLVELENGTLLPDYFLERLNYH